LVKDWAKNALLRGAFLFALYDKIDEAVKSQKSDGTVKSFRCKARCRWTFYEAVKINPL